MRATTIHAARDIRLEDVPDPAIEAPTDAIVKVVAGCICGSDLWPYRGENDDHAGRTIGHECVGVVEEVGSDVASFTAGRLRRSCRSCHCDNTCPHCRAGMHVGLRQPRLHRERPGASTPASPRPTAASSRPTACPTTSMLPSLLTLADVMATGWHAAVAAGVQPGRHRGRRRRRRRRPLRRPRRGRAGRRARRSRCRATSRARRSPAQFGATHVVAERGEEGSRRVMDLTDGVGADAVLECVGTDESMKTAFARRPPRLDRRLRRRAARRRAAGAPDVRRRTSASPAAWRPCARYLPDLLERVLVGRDRPGQGLRPDAAARPRSAEGYRAMDERRAIKVLLRP